MTTFEQMQIASFKGFQFLIESDDTNRGNKTAIHEYPNVDKRFVERLGKLPPTFTINAIIHGDNSIQRRLAFESILESDGPGTLVHPVYGNIQVEALPFSVNSNQTRVGEFRYSIPFAASSPNIAPTPVAPNKQTVSAASEIARIALNDAFEDAYQDPVKGSTLTAIADKTTTMYDTVKSAINAITSPIESNAATFNRIVNDAITTATITIQSATDFKIALQNVYNSALLIANTPDLMTTAWNNLLNFNIGESGNSSDVGPVNTVQRQRKESDKSIIDENTRLNALINLYESYAYTLFATINEIETARALLDDAYNRYMELAIAESEEAGVSTLASNSNVRSSMSDLRNKSRINFDTQEQNVWKVVTIEPGVSSMALVAYRYYGSLDTLDELTGLNTDVNAAGILVSEIQAVTK
jgi:prophage DNA circulation protein